MRAHTLYFLCATGGFGCTTFAADAAGVVGGKTDAAVEVDVTVDVGAGGPSEPPEASGGVQSGPPVAPTAIGVAGGGGGLLDPQPPATPAHRHTTAAPDHKTTEGIERPREWFFEDMLAPAPCAATSTRRTSARYQINIG